MSGKGANAGLLVDHLQQGDGVSFFAAAIPSGINQVPFPHVKRGDGIQVDQGGCASAASRKVERTRWSRNTHKG